MSLFDQVYEKFKISESIEGLDDTKDVYGYSLKTFIAEELELFNAFANAILRDTEAKKRDLQRHTDGTNHSASLLVQYTHNSEFKRVVDNLKKGVTASAWSYFYHPAIKQVGGIKLTQETDKTFSLTFGGESNPNQSDTCSETENWKEFIIERLKFFVVDGFYTFLDSFPFKTVSSTSSLTKSLKEFFDWREEKIKFKQLGIKLPELEGIFENESKQDYVFIVTFDKTYQLQKLENVISFLLSVQGSNDSTYEINDKQQLVLTVKDLKRWNFNDKQERDRFARTFYNAYNAVAQQLNPRVSYTAKFKSKYEDIVKKLPELEGIFESEEKDLFVLTVTWNNLDSKNKYMLEKLLKSLQERHGKARKIEFLKDNNMLGLRYYGLDFPINETAKDQFEHHLKNCITLLFPNWTVDAEKEFLTKIFENFHSKCVDQKVYDMQNKLPELEGIFESVAQTDPNFSLMKKEKEAIEEFAETVQKLFQNYEERIVALMKTLRKSYLELQDKTLDKYIGLVHLRNDLRLAAGKICKKHLGSIKAFQAHQPIYVQYEKIFLSPITGCSNWTEGGVVLKYQDGVFEIVFDAYNYVLGEPIVVSKSIEPVEVKDYLIQLLTKWMNVIITNKEYLHFSPSYLEFREEETKFNKMKEQLPELEEIF